jgi:hypothetical protein
MIVIKVGRIEGYYYVAESELIYCHSDNDADTVQVSDLTELRIWQYNQLVRDLKKAYPNWFEMEELKGRFI